MEQELKVSDLARIWNVSVNTTWKRIKKDGLLTTKKAVNNRDIAFIKVDSEYINKYFQDNVNNGVNNGDYEELLRVNEPPKSNVNSQEVIDKVIEYSKGVNEQLIMVTNDYSQRVNNLYEEKNKAEKQLYLLEDSERRTKAEINEIKANAKTLESRNKILLVLITGLSTLLIMVVVVMGYLLYKANNKPPQQQEPKVVTKIIKVDQKGNVVSTLTK